MDPEGWQKIEDIFLQAAEVSKSWSKFGQSRAIWRAVSGFYHHLFIYHLTLSANVDYVVHSFKLELRTF